MRLTPDTLPTRSATPQRRRRRRETATLLGISTGALLLVLGVQALANNLVIPKGPQPGAASTTAVPGPVYSQTPQTAVPSYPGGYYGTPQPTTPPAPQYTATPPSYGDAPANDGEPEAAAGTPREAIMILLDVSASMEEPLPNGEMKMEAAKRTLIMALNKMPPGTLLGIRVFGTNSDPLTQCFNATRRLAPLGVNNRPFIAQAMAPLQPTGGTPITSTIHTSLRDDFNNVPPGVKRKILLISDGQETCGADPCPMALNLIRSGASVQIDVVGYGALDDGAIRQLKCVATATYGKFYRAETSAKLGESLQRAMKPQIKVSGQVVTKDAPAAGGGTGAAGGQTAPSRRPTMPVELQAPSAKPTRR